MNVMFINDYNKHLDYETLAGVKINIKGGIIVQY